MKSFRWCYFQDPPVLLLVGAEDPEEADDEAERADERRHLGRTYDMTYLFSLLYASR